MTKSVDTASLGCFLEVGADVVQSPSSGELLLSWLDQAQAPCAPILTFASWILSAFPFPWGPCHPIQSN